MNPFAICETKELSNPSSEVNKTTRAFENASNREVKTPRHITTINENLEGKCYPGTDVKYAKRTFMLNGEKVEGVFPQFDSKFDCRLPKDLRTASIPVFAFSAVEDKIPRALSFAASASDFI